MDIINKIKFPIKIKQAVIVEGKYDKIKLSAILNTVIITTNGFQIFKDVKKINLIKDLANKNGLLIITDSDSAGFLIRNYIKGIVNEKNIKHIYLPDIYGKEKRKDVPSKEGKIGLEGIPNKIIINVLKSSGIILNSKSNEPQKPQITKLNLYEHGFIGKENSTKKRKALLRYLNLPEYLSTNALLKTINTTSKYSEYVLFCKTILHHPNKENPFVK